MPDSRHDRPPPDRGPRSLSDEALVAAMRRGDPRAIDEFLMRFHPLLVHRARKAGFWRGENVSDQVLEVLEDVGMLLAAGRARPRRSLVAYLFVILRHRYFEGSEVDRKHASFLDDFAAEIPGEDGRLLRELCSENMLRAGALPDEEAPRLSPALERLATMLDEGLTTDERYMLGCLSNHVPQRHIAEWLGLTYAAATQRIWRLRERLRNAAMEHAVQFEPHERHELRNFFRRAHVPYGEVLSPGMETALAGRGRVAEPPPKRNPVPTNDDKRGGHDDRR